ncbi:MAG: MFS transporter, partial [Alphaproteobacteria bacterium]|nr:MFS transporter [Alphaproteobacteria bacterium]MDX5368211.1 MFS transporter [Alphaproteobacteria bacterium]
METQSSRVSHPDIPTWLVIGSGILALAVAMGIGRFAFTPLMPLMLRDGTLTATSGAEWAAANYGGYLAGALTAAWFSGNPQGGLRWALVGVALSTLAIAAVGDGTASVLLGAILRAAAGVFSAWALVCASSWCLGELARRREPQWGAWIYTGVGLGIVLAGMLAWLGGRQPAHWLWLELGLVALAAASAVGVVLRGHGRRRAAPAARAVSDPPVQGPGHLPLVFCYGAMGFGYILPATFLPAMAREQVSDPLIFGITWPVFGLAAALSVAVAARWLSSWPRRKVWALAQAAMAVGTALPLVTEAL